MEHIYWVIDNLLGGRPGPQLEPWDPAELAAGGVQTVVSLSQEEEIEDLSPYGLTHRQADFPPVLLFSKGMQKAFIYQALPVWAYIDDQLKAGSPVIVHCHHGKDRTGAILAGYLVVYRGVEPREALRRLRSAKPDAMTAQGYEDVLSHLRPSVIPDPRTLL